MKLTQTVISTVLLAASAVAATEGASYGGNYYELHPNPENRGTWTDAEADAANMSHCGVKGHLAKITSQGENDFIVGLGEVDDVAGVWIGLNDIAMEDEWVWHDDGALCAAYNAWDIGQPGHEWGPKNEDCVGLGLVEKTSKWHDFPCDETVGRISHYVVEFD